MYATTEGGQYGADCAGWARNLHEQVIWTNNANTQGAYAARGIPMRGVLGGVVGNLIGRIGGGNGFRTLGQPVPIGLPRYGGEISNVFCRRTYNDGRVEVYAGHCHG
jgi:hypothetical protein